MLDSKPPFPTQIGVSEGLSDGLDPRTNLIPFSLFLPPHVTKMDYFKSLFFPLSFSMKTQKVLGAAQLVGMVGREGHIPWRWDKVGILAGVHANDELKCLCQNTLPLWKGKSVFFLTTHQSQKTLLVQNLRNVS